MFVWQVPTLYFTIAHFTCVCDSSLCLLTHASYICPGKKQAFAHVCLELWRIEDISSDIKRQLDNYFSQIDFLNFISSLLVYENETVSALWFEEDKKLQTQTPFLPSIKIFTPFVSFQVS